jgi:hypothetical protein
MSMKDEPSNVREYQIYALPEEFWVSLLQVRNYLMRDDAFVQRIYGEDKSPLLREAFDLMDSWLATML